MSSTDQKTELPEKFNFFTSDISGIELPEKFTYPFCYEPHVLAKIASKELQEQVIAPTQWQHNFGLASDNTDKAVGKMFGVLVVKSAEGQIGYLAAYSGILTGVDDHPHFVPLLYNRFHQDDFFRQGSKVLDQFHVEIEAAENHPAYAVLREKLSEATAQSEKEIADLRAENIAAKKIRKQRRQEGKATLSEEAYAELDKELQRESIGR
jgi:tRNA pseudouridine32 synthase/23S rRNA pseudouridine746 synthase